MRIKTVLTSASAAVLLALSTAAPSAELGVKITPDLDRVVVKHAGKPVILQRNQNENATIQGEYARTSRKCPPSCIQPGTIAPGVEASWR